MEIKIQPITWDCCILFLKQPVSAVSEGLRSFLEGKYEIILNSASEHLVRDWALKHRGLYR